MKHLHFLLLIIAVIGIMTACNPDEKKENPLPKLSGVYYESSVLTLHIKEAWTWSNNLLSKIDYYTSSGTVWTYENFEYKDSILFEITDRNDASQAFSYESSLLKKIIYYDESGQLYKTVQFGYDNDKIVSIENVFNDTTGNYSNISLEWDNNNIKKASYVVSEDSIIRNYSYTYSYDDKVNPKKGHFNQSSSWCESLSENNLIQRIYTDSLNSTENYTYKYSSNYPIEKHFSNGNYSYTYYYVYE